MLKRKTLQTLFDWKAQDQKKPLIIRGARQVGKSTLVTELGNSYKNFVMLNLERSAHAKFFTEYVDDVKQIINAIELEFNVDLLKGDALLFIDEIQEVPLAISLLRYFHEDTTSLDVIAAGSLLEFALEDVQSFPVGRVQQIPLYPLDFEEFLTALNEDKALALYNTIPMPEYAHPKLFMLFQEYTLIGGMPEIVSAYVNNGKQLNQLNKIYSSIWDNYRDDIEKYGNNSNEKKVLNHVISTAPNIRDRITFNGFGSSNYGSREVSEAFRKLQKAGIIKLIYPTTDLVAPIIANLKRKPKIQFLDTGLLNYASNIQLELMAVKDLNNLYRGYIINHVIFQELIAMSDRLYDVPFFWTRESTTANAEVDAVVQFQNFVIPIEIKSGPKGSLKSLHEFIERCDHIYAFRLLANTFSIEKSVTRSGKEFILANLPYYSIGKIHEWINYVIQNQKLLPNGKE